MDVGKKKAKPNQEAKKRKSIPPIVANGDIKKPKVKKEDSDKGTGKKQKSFKAKKSVNKNEGGGKGKATEKLKQIKAEEKHSAKGEKTKEQVTAKKKAIKELKAKKVKGGGDSTKKGSDSFKKKGKENRSTEKLDPKAAREKKKKLKEERQKKAKTEDVFALGARAKQVWEKARRDDCPEHERKTLLEELLSTVKGSVKKIIFAHDTVRVIECLMALGSDEIREALFQEVKNDIVEMAKSKYASFFVTKLIKYGSKEQRQIIAKAFEGRVCDLMKHKIANGVVETFYNEHANAATRNGMLQEFCGAEFRSFKEPEIRTVADLIKSHPEKEKHIVKSLSTIVPVLITKGCYNHSLVHAVIHEYLTVCSQEQRTETIQQLRDVCVHVLHSRHGARLSLIALWHGTSKDRKAIVKSFKTFVAKVCEEEQGHLVLMALFDTVDDTKLVSKVILSEIIDNLPAIASNKFGRAVLTYLLAHRCTKYQHPQVIDILKEGDGNEHTKKPAETRMAELNEAFAPAMCKYLVASMSDQLTNNSYVILLLCALNHGPPAAMLPALSQLAEEAAKPFASGEDEESNIVEESGSHMMLKKLISQDTERHAAGHKLFSVLVLEAMDDESAEAWVRCNRGAFLFVKMLETNIEQVNNLVKDKLKCLKKTLQIQTSKGAEVLRKLLA